jgi:pentatricopeptide repeat protein
MIVPVLEALRKYNDPNGDIVNDTVALESSTKKAVQSGNTLTICMMYCTRMCCLYSAGEYEKALKVLDEKKSVANAMGETIFDSFAILMEGLICFSCARNTPKGSTRVALIQRGKKAMKLLLKLSLQNPDSCAGKAVLLEAQYAAVCKKNSLAKQKYSQAIALSVGHSNYFETILSKRLAGIHYCVDLDDGRTGIKYLEESIRDCEAWGGHAPATIWKNKVAEIRDTHNFSILGQKY